MVSSVRLAAREMANLVNSGASRWVGACAGLRFRHALLVMAVVVCAGLAVSAVAAREDRPGPVAPASGPASFAPQSPAYSHLTADIEHAPLGRAVALYQQGTDVELFDF